MDKPRTLHPALFYPLFFVSGAAGLVYQSLWLRLFTLVLGNSLHSAAVVLAAFMAGLALGAWAAGRRLERVKDRLGLYALIELGIAATGLGTGWLIPRIGPLSAWMVASLPAGPVFAASVRFILSFAVLLLPTALIGATLPVLSQHLTPRLELAGRRIGSLYGWNAAGAVAGCVLTGFWLLRLAGMHATLLAAAALNLAVFAAALALRAMEGKAQTQPVKTQARGAHPAPVHGPRVLVEAAALTGAAMLALEPVWARFLSYIVFNDMYVYYLMLAVILAGIGLGSLVYGALLERRLVSVTALGWLETALGLSAAACYLATGWHYGRPESGLAIRHLQGLFPDGFLGLLAVRTVYAVLVMFLPALLSGIIFPLTCRLYCRDERAVGRDTGVIYAANTLGAVAGALLGGLVLIPRLGVQPSLFLAAAATLYLGCRLLLADGKGKKASWKLRASLAAVILVFIAGAALPANQVRRFALKERAHQAVLFYHEGLTGTVLVTRDKLNGLRNLFINAIAEVHDSFGGMQTFKLMGHLPFLLHRGPAQSVLMVTYGAGIASGAVAVHPIKALHVVELEPAVVEASRQFADRNRSVMDDPRVRIHLEDGRNYLYTTGSRFDIIISDATNPGSADSWLLYTVEFYRLCHSRLAPGGVMAQWLPLHTGTLEGYCAILAAFQDVFPHTSIWFTKDYTLLVGLPDKLEVSWPGLRAALAQPALRDDLAPWCLDQPLELAECFLTGEDGVRRLIGSTRPNSDDRPYYQLSATEQGGAEDILTLLDRYRERENVFLRGVSVAEAPALTDSMEARFQAEHYILFRDYPNADRVLPGRCNVSHYLEEYRGEPDYLAAVADSNPECYYVQRRSASGLAARGDYLRAARIFGRMAGLDPADPVLRYNRGNLLLEAGQADSAITAYREALALGRRDSDILGRLGRAYLKAGQAEAALPVLDEAVSLDSSNVEALFHLGYALNRNGRQTEAIACYERLVARFPDYVNALINLGFLRLGQGDNIRAETVLSRASQLEPGNFQGWYGLGMARLRLGQNAAAATAFREALELRPGDTEVQGILEKMK
ncbi:fused MFS/spermidine synthase [bacterium]|nr:fused MFS/spermidine synthase [bacterium]